MTRIAKQAERRHKSPRKRHYPSPKTGSLKDNLPLGYKEKINCISGAKQALTFIPKIK